MLKCICLSAALSFALTDYAQTKNFIDQAYLEVAGSADTMVVPNEIFIRVFVSEKNTKDKRPLQETEAAMYQALSSIGINTEKDLMVHDMCSTFKSYFLKTTSVIKSREYIVKVKDATTAGRVFVELEKLDIADSRIFAVNHTGIDDIKNSLRSRAVENARTRAVALTKPLNQAVGKAIHLEDNEEYGTGERVNGTFRKLKSEFAGNSSGYMIDKVVDIDFTKITVGANVKVKFVLL